MDTVNLRRPTLDGEKSSTASAPSAAAAAIARVRWLLREAVIATFDLDGELSIRTEDEEEEEEEAAGARCWAVRRPATTVHAEDEESIAMVAIAALAGAVRANRYARP